MKMKQRLLATLWFGLSGLVTSQMSAIVYNQHDYLFHCFSTAISGFLIGSAIIIRSQSTMWSVFRGATVGLLSIGISVVFSLIQSSPSDIEMLFTSLFLLLLINLTYSWLDLVIGGVSGGVLHLIVNNFRVKPNKKMETEKLFTPTNLT